MEKNPPLRPEIATEAISYLRAGSNVTLAGTRLSGRSTVLRQVIDGLGQYGIAVVNLAGIRALQDRPLAALAIAGMTTGPAGSLQSLTSAVKEIEAELSAKQAVLAVDDSDDLDSTTVGALAAVHTHLGLPVVSVGRPDPPTTGRSDRIRLGDVLQPAVRITVPPLRFDGVHRLVHELLGGPVDPSAVARIAANSGGLPGLVCALINTARRANHLIMREGLWDVHGSLWTTPLTSCVEPLLADLDASSRDAITLLAHAGTLTWDDARRIAGPQALAGLDDAGLLQVVPTPNSFLVGVFPPLVADYVTHEGSPTRQLLARSRLAETRTPVTAQPTPPTAPPHTAAANSEALEPFGGEPIRTRHIALHWSDKLEARRRAWESNPTPNEAVLYLEALAVSTSRPHEFDAVFARTRLPAHTLVNTTAEPEFFAPVPSLTPAPPGAGDDAPTSHTPADDEALARFLAWHASYTKLIAARSMRINEPLSALRTELPDFAGLFRATDAQLQLITSCVPPLDLLDDASPSESALSRDFVTVARAEALIASGQARAALKLLDNFTSNAADVTARAHVSRGLALLYTCEFDTAIDTAMAHAEQAHSACDIGTVEANAYVAGLGLVLQGRLAELDALMSSALALPTMPAHYSHFQTGLLTLAAVAAKWQRRSPYARSLMLQASGLRRPRGPHPYMASDAVEAIMRDGDDDTTADAMWQVARERLDHGFRPAGILAGVVAVERKPDPARAAQLVAAAADCDCPLPAHLGAYAAAVAAEEPHRLKEMEAELGAAGLRLFAVRAAVTRAIQLLDAGDTTGAFEQAGTAWCETGLRGRDLCGLFLQFDRAVNLTAREREVAVMVAQGKTSHEMADLLVLSIRTVENHIFNACRKVGVDTREGLARAAQTWLSCTTQ